MKKPILIITAVVLLLIISGSAYAFIKHRNSSNISLAPERRTFTVRLAALNGGTCTYRTTGGDSVCINPDSMQSVLDSHSSQIPAEDQNYQATIDADVSYKTEKLSGATPTPSYTEEKVMTINKVYSFSVEPYKQ